MTTSKQQLMQELAEAERELRQVNEQLAEKPDLGPGTGSTGAVTWEMALARKERIKQHIQELQHALDRLDSGAYGRCQICGAEIDPERLEIIPTAATCANCAWQARAA